MDHAGELHVHRPLQRAVHLRGDVVPGDRLADDLQLLHRFHGREAGGLVDVPPRQRDIEAPPADEFAVGDRARGIRADGDDSLVHGEIFHGPLEVLGGQLQQDPPRLGRDPARGEGVALDRVGTAGAALVDRHVGAAHDERGVGVRDVESSHIICRIAVPVPWPPSVLPT